MGIHMEIIRFSWPFICVFIGLFILVCRDKITKKTGRISIQRAKQVGFPVKTGTVIVCAILIFALTGLILNSSSNPDMVLTGVWISRKFPLLLLAFGFGERSDNLFLIVYV